MKTAIRHTIAAAALAIAVFAGTTGHAAPASFAYQGVIHELNGNAPTNKNRVIEFRLYSDPSSPEALWGRTCNVLLDKNGLFNAPLADASGTPLEGVPDSKLADVLAQQAGTTLYVGLTVDGSSGEISPRQAILSVPYAIHADDAASASGDFVVAGEVTAGTLKVDGAVTLGATEAARLSVDGNVEITGGDGAFAGPGTIPVGGIIMWNGAADHIPEGWALCDGNNGTPNLSGRFVVGFDPNDAAYNTVGNTGGAPVVTLALEQMPSHTHGLTTESIGYVSGFTTPYQEVPTFPEKNFHDESEQSNGTKFLGTSSAAGGSQPHENRPPYYVICYIMRVK